METRRQEFERLKLTLQGMDMYESFMTSQEMRKLLNALEKSQQDYSQHYKIPTKVSDTEMDQADNMGNSTMISVHDYPIQTDPDPDDCDLGEDALPFNSPQKPSQLITIRAQVHRAFDSPPRREDRSLDSAEREESVADRQPEPRRNNGKLEEDPLPAFMRNDSGVNCSHETADSSSLDDATPMSIDSESEETASFASSSSHMTEQSEVSMQYFDYDDDSNTSL